MKDKQLSTNTQSIAASQRKLWQILKEMKEERLKDKNADNILGDIPDDFKGFIGKVKNADKKITKASGE